MTIHQVHTLAAGRRSAQLLVAERSQVESPIAVRAIQRLCPHLDVRPVAGLAEAEGIIVLQQVTTVLIGSGLDDLTHWETIRWFADRTGEAVVIALLEGRDHQQRRQALEVGASYVCSKPDLLVTQLRHQAECRMALAAADTPVPLNRYCWDR